MTEEPGRVVPVVGLFNARDLGGLPLEGGEVTPSRVFLRSDQPDLVTASGWDELWSQGVRTVLDLRQPVERHRFPTRPRDGMVDLTVDHDGLQDHPEFWADYWDNGLVGTPLYYLPHLAALPQRSVAVLAAIAGAPPGGILFHCAGGRDRTGLIAALLLRAAGVHNDAILTDYLDTITNAAQLAAGRGRPDNEDAVAELLAIHHTTSEAAFRAFLAGLDIDRLLAALSPDQAAAIRTWRGTLPA